MLRHALFCLSLLLAAILMGISCPAGSARAGDSKMSVSQTTQSDTQPYVAIMGQVGRPGVFELPVPLPQLAEFLNLAGGITPNASGSIRVIRGGRSSQYFLSPKLSLQLIPDDLVIVESKQFVAGRQNGNTSSANGWQRNAGTLSAAPTPAVVQIGLVNLISRPVILDVPREQANLAQVLSLLRQPVTDKGLITVIKPGSGMQNVSLEQAFETSLATGMVLVFDPATVNSAVLPRLPNTIRPDAVAAIAIADTSADSTPVQSTVPETALTEMEPAGRRSPLVPQVTSPGVSDRSSPSLNTESAGVSPEVSLMGAAGPSTAAEGSRDASRDSQDFQAPPEETNEQSSDLPRAAARIQPSFSRASLVMLTGVVAGCLSLLLWSRFKQRSQPAAKPSSSEPIDQPDDSLELIISGELPMVEEPLQLSYESQIFGRPLQTSRHRTDSVQVLSGPHFVPQPSLPKTEPVVVAEPAQDPSPRAGDRRFRVDMRHPRSTASVLDRALATFEGEQP